MLALSCRCFAFNVAFNIVDDLKDHLKKKNINIYDTSKNENNLSTIHRGSNWGQVWGRKVYEFTSSNIVFLSDAAKSILVQWIFLFALIILLYIGNKTRVIATGTWNFLCLWIPIPYNFRELHWNIRPKMYNIKMQSTTQTDTLLSDENITFKLKTGWWCKSATTEPALL